MTPDTNLITATATWAIERTTMVDTTMMMDDPTAMIDNPTVTTVGHIKTIGIETGLIEMIGDTTTTTSTIRTTILTIATGADLSRSPGDPHSLTPINPLLRNASLFLAGMLKSTLSPSPVITLPVDESSDPKRAYKSFVVLSQRQGGIYSTLGAKYQVPQPLSNVPNLSLILMSHRVPPSPYTLMSQSVAATVRVRLSTRLCIPHPESVKIHTVNFVVPLVWVPVYFFFPPVSQADHPVKETVPNLISSLADVLKHFLLLVRTIKPDESDDLNVYSNSVSTDFVYEQRNNKFPGQHDQGLNPRSLDIGLPVPGDPLIVVKFTVFTCGTYMLCIITHHIIGDLSLTIDFAYAYTRHFANKLYISLDSTPTPFISFAIIPVHRTSLDLEGSFHLPGSFQTDLAQKHRSVSHKYSINIPAK